MSEFFIELFSEEIPAGLQKDLREKLLVEFEKLFTKKSIRFKKSFSNSVMNNTTILSEKLGDQENLIHLG